MNKIKIIFIFISLNLNVLSQKTEKAYKILRNMITELNQLQSVQLIQYSKERKNIRPEFNEKTTEYKILFKPQKKLYLKIYNPDGTDGPEILYDEQKSKDKVYINPNAFPYFNFNLNYYSSLILKKSHNPLTHAGLKYFAKILSSILFKEMKENNMSINLQKTEYNNRKCFKITILNNNFKLISYKVNKNDNILTISEKFNISYHSILIRNDDIDDIFDVEEGQEIIIPNSYAKKIVLYIGEHDYIPWGKYFEDDYGFYAKYELKKCYLNLEFDNQTFSRDNENYGF